MSASPLPAVQPASPSPATNTGAPARRSSQHDSDTSFDAHLQNAQNQQPSGTQQDGGGNGGDAQASGGQVAGIQANGTAKPGADAETPGADTTSDSAAGTSVASLTNTVLNLIDQVAGDAGSSSATTGSGTKAASEKSTTPAPQTAPSPALQAAVAVQTPPPPIVANNGSTGANASASAATQQANAISASGSNPLLGLTALNPQKSPGGTASLDDDAAADGSDDSDAGVLNIASDNSALLQSLGDSTQALAGALPAGGHLSQALAGASSATSTPTQSAPDLAALHGVFDATGLTASSGAATTSGHSLAVDTPVGASGFAKELGQQVTWLSGQEVKQAQIRLNPQDLGPLDVKVSVEHGRVDVAFMTQHPAAAAAVQQGLGQLNQMLGGQGLSLGHTSVGQHGAQQQFANSQGQSSQAQTSGDSEDKTEQSSVSTLQRVAVGLVDAFA